MKYRKKPVVIEAAVFNGTTCWGEVYPWLIEATQKDPIEVGSIRVDTVEQTASILTLEGVMKASLGDYIIRGVKGEIYPCKPDIFAATYEAA